LAGLRRLFRENAIAAAAAILRATER